MSFQPDQLGSFAADIYEEMRPLTWAEADNEYALAKFVGAVGELFQVIETLVRDTETHVGWGQVMDPEVAPTEWLPWLGQFVGTPMDQRQRLVQYINLILNPSMEHQSTLWWVGAQSAGTTIEQAPVRSTIWSKIRPSSLYFRHLNPDATIRTQGIQTPFITGISPGEAFFASCDANVLQVPAGGPGPSLKIYFVNSGGSVIGTVSAGDVGIGESHSSIVNAIAPANTTQVIVGFTAQADANGERLEAYVDNVMLVRTDDDITFYFDGSLPSSQWTGTPDASTSEYLALEDEDLYWDRQRQLIADHVGFKRGSPTGMVDAIKAYLTGTKTVFFFERDTSPYHFRISTFADETPNPAKVEEILRSYKPAGLVMVYSAIGGSDWATELGVHASWTALSGAHASWEHVYTTGH